MHSYFEPLKLTIPLYEFEIYDTISTYAKVYPTFTSFISFKRPIKVRRKGFEPRTTPTAQRPSLSADTTTAADSLRRTKTRLSDIVLCNEFDLFVTFTFAKDRTDVAKLKYTMSRWLKNEQRRVGKFKYLIVPEFHKDGKAIHFHALFSGYSGDLFETGLTRKDGRPVYNLLNYTHGFSTATKIDNEGLKPVSSYIKKYITKSMPLFAGKKRYWSSQALKKPIKIINPIQPDLTQFASYEFDNTILYKSEHPVTITSEYDIRMFFKRPDIMTTKPIRAGDHNIIVVKPDIQLQLY